jgi:hypothetical protein
MPDTEVIGLFVCIEEVCAGPKRESDSIATKASLESSPVLLVLYCLSLHAAR